MTRVRAKQFAVVLVAGSALLLTACTTNPSSTQSNATTLPTVGATNATLHVGSTQASFSGLNPFNSQGNTFLEYTYDSLLRPKSDGTVEGQVAKSWTVDGSSITLTIRDGLEFPDGTAEDASAVKKSLDFGIAHGQGSNLGSSCYTYLKGASTSLVGSNQVKLTLAQVTPGITQQLAKCNGWIVNPKDITSTATAAKLDKTPDPTGPYTVDASGTVAGHTETFERRDDYFDKESYAYKKIVWTFYASTTALNNAAKSGQVDITNQIFDPTDTSSGLTLVSGTPDEFRGLYLTDVTGKVVPALGNVKVRQAMQYAIDRKSITKALYGSKAIATSGIPTRPGYLGYSASLASTYSYNVAKAKTLLKQAGYGSGFTATVLVDPPDEKLAQAMAGYLKKVGVTLNISVHSNDFITQMLTGKYPLVSGNFTLDPAQFETVNAIIGKDAFWNPNHNTNADFESALQSLSTKNPTDAGVADEYTALNKKIAEQAWFLNPTIVPTVYGVNTKTTAVSPVPGLTFPPANVIKPKSAS